MSWAIEKSNGVLLLLYIQPRTSRTEIVGLHGEPPRLKIRVAAPPVEGEANEELVAFLSKKLEISKSAIQIQRGESGRHKSVFCVGVKTEKVQELLQY